MWLTERKAPMDRCQLRQAAGWQDDQPADGDREDGGDDGQDGPQFERCVSSRTQNRKAVLLICPGRVRAGRLDEMAHSVGGQGAVEGREPFEVTADPTSAREFGFFVLKRAGITSVEEAEAVQIGD